MRDSGVAQPPQIPRKQTRRSSIALATSPAMETGAYRAVEGLAYAFPKSVYYSAKASSCMRERKRRTAFVCSWDTRDSVTPSTSPISRNVRFS